ncbi:MAG: undecaprenyldiphospho-muramoylpentapeptide beta-N-acetylglucosaminyltransferase [Candidatus Moranbacteria bacterium]|nr:undecaprenyldiphospho-muramoylpentapeptide beta-N-acetylglucosaminyltransferase [Candidatus Moranbacteria bacterium]
MAQEEKRIVLTGGLSGGHVFPLVAVSRAVRDRAGVPSRFLYVGSKGIFEETAMKGDGIEARHILSGKVRRYFSIMNLIDPFKTVIGFIQSLWHLFIFMPDVVFAKGGAVSVPVCLAARIYRIPYVIHDSDAVAGMASRVLSRHAARIAIAYPHALTFFPPERTAITGNPVREELLSGDPNRAGERFKLLPDRPVVLVLGGSLGAQSLNRAIVRILPNLLREAQVLHQTGTDKHHDAVSRAGELGIKAGRDGYHAIPFFHGTDLADAFARADIVVSRAGASTIAELAACGKPAILVPLPTAANDEQRMNAFEVAKQGGAIVLEEQNLGEHMLFTKIDSILRDPLLRADMSQKIRAFYNPQAAVMIADGVLSLC